MVWAGIINAHLIGPFFFDENVNGQSYLNMLLDNVIPALNAIGLAFDDIIFQHDGAPAHASLFVRDWLDAHSDAWIGRGGPVDWPARSPDFNPLDFFLWSHVKNRVYQTLPDMDDLRQRIQDAFDAVTPDMLIALQGNFIQRMHMTIEQEGGHIEQFT